ncbi:MAG: hypothetical protein OXG37_00250 [Actinomycetia bacterium]|nr:hypothetical protein [Actinomycetes bacterium]
MKGIAATVAVAVVCKGLGAVGGLVAAESVERTDQSLRAGLADARRADAELGARLDEIEQRAEAPVVWRRDEIERRLANVEERPIAIERRLELLQQYAFGDAFEITVP